MTEGDVAHDTATKEGGLAVHRLVHDLVRKGKVSGFVVLVQGPHCGDRKEILDTKGLQGIDVSLVVDLCGGEHVVTAVAREECTAHAADSGNADLITWRSKRGVNLDGSGILEALKAIDAAASDHSDQHWFHILILKGASTRAGDERKIWPPLWRVKTQRVVPPNGKQEPILTTHTIVSKTYPIFVTRGKAQPKPLASPHTHTYCGGGLRAAHRPVQ